MTPPNPPTPQSVSSTGTGELLKLHGAFIELYRYAHKITPLANFEGGCPVALQKAMHFLPPNYSPATPPKMNAGETPRCDAVLNATRKDAADEMERIYALARTLERELAQLAARLVEVEKRTIPMCSCCAGTGKPVSGLPCICGGHGTQDGELQGFREEHYDLTQKLATAEAALVQAKQDLKREVDLVDSMTVQRVPVNDAEVREFVLVALSRHTLLNDRERQDCADQILTVFAPAWANLEGARRVNARLTQAEHRDSATITGLRAANTALSAQMEELRGEAVRQDAEMERRQEHVVRAESSLMELENLRRLSKSWESLTDAVQAKRVEAEAQVEELKLDGDKATKLLDEASDALYDALAEIGLFLGSCSDKEIKDSFMSLKKSADHAERVRNKISAARAHAKQNGQEEGA